MRKRALRTEGTCAASTKVNPASTRIAARDHEIVEPTLGTAGEATTVTVHLRTAAAIATQGAGVAGAGGGVVRQSSPAGPLAVISATPGWTARKRALAPMNVFDELRSATTLISDEIGGVQGRTGVPSGR